MKTRKELREIGFTTTGIIGYYLLMIKPTSDKEIRGKLRLLHPFVLFPAIFIETFLFFKAKIKNTVYRPFEGSFKKYFVWI